MKKNTGRFEKGHINSDEVRRKISLSLTGRKKHPLSEETKMKLRLANLGKKQSFETIVKRVAKLKGRVYTPEQRMHISVARKNGKVSRPAGTWHHSKETLKKIADSNRGQIRGSIHTLGIRVIRFSEFLIYKNIENQTGAR